MQKEETLVFSLKFVEGNKSSMAYYEVSAKNGKVKATFAVYTDEEVPQLGEVYEITIKRKGLPKKTANLIELSRDVQVFKSQVGEDNVSIGLEKEEADNV